MHEILILYILLKGQSTMYGISKTVSKLFGYITNPSFGTIQPALKRLEKKSFVKSDKFFTEGGKPYFYYSITPQGKEFLVDKLKSKPSKNPIQLFPEIKIKLTCLDILTSEDKKELCKVLKAEVLKLKTQAESILSAGDYDDNYTGRMVLDNSVCEYKNMYDLIERLEKNAGNS